MFKKINDRAKKSFLRRQTRTRYRIRKNAPNKVRLSVFISNMHIYAQVIDDKAGVTLASASTVDKLLKPELGKTSNKEAATAVGKAIAERALANNVTEVVFDKGGRKYHGKIKSLADSAREHGLQF